MKRSLFLVPLVVLAACNPLANDWTDDCEDAFKYRLKSPASYKRIEANVIATDIDIEDYIFEEGDRLSEIEMKSLREKNPPIKQWITLITYDASNSFGVAIRDKFHCKEITQTGKPPKGGRSDTEKELIMKVNGISGQRAIIDALK